MGKKKAVFFDRDGTLNINTNYLHKKEDFVWIEDAVEAIRYVKEKGYLAIVLTNQSGVARGFYTEDDVKKLHAWMNEELKKCGTEIDAFYYCPYHIEGTIPAYTKISRDRKPNIGMIEKACVDFDIAVKESYLVGDMPSDILCARRAGATPIRYERGSLLTCVKRGLKGIREIYLKEEVLESIRHFAKEHDIEKVILFGSRARGDHHENSDTNLAVLGGDVTEFSFAMEEAMHASFDVINLERDIDEELRREIQREGIVIYGAGK